LRRGLNILRNIILLGMDTADALTRDKQKVYRELTRNGFLTNE
jgi:hypothetical protein